MGFYTSLFFNAIMKGWILYKKNKIGNKWASPGINRLVEEAEIQKLDVEVIDPDEIDLIVTQENQRSIRINDKVEPLPDYVITRMGSTTPYYTLAVIRHLERIGIPTFNSSIGINNARDKLFCQQLLAQYNLPVPKTMFARFPVNINLVEKILGLPIIVKTVHGKKGSGVFLCETEQSFEDLMQLIEATKPNVNIILQEFIAPSRGKDVRAFVVGGRVVGTMQRTGKEGSFKANFSAGGNVQSYPITPELEWLAIESSRVLGLDIAGVDLLFDTDGFKICEVNASPGFKGLELANPNLNVAQAVYEYIRLRVDN